MQPMLRDAGQPSRSMAAPSMPPSIIATPMGKTDASGICRAMKTRLLAAARTVMRLTARFKEIALRMR